jgi:hypothetical protein
MPATPKGLSDEKAARMMLALREGRTLSTFGVRAPRLEAYFKAHPEYAREARPLIEKNKGAALLRKGAHMRALTHCKHGHSLADAYVVHQRNGYVKRNCRTCWKLCVDRAVIKPEVAKKVEALLRRGASINSFTKPGSYLVRHNTFTRFRIENPQINALFLKNQKDAKSRAQRLRWVRIRNAAKRDQTNDYHKLRAMLPPNFPDKDDVVSAIFEDMLTGALKREDVRGRLQSYITAHNRMFPTKYAKFGDSPLVSLDEQLFEDGATTRGDTVSRGLWDQWPLESRGFVFRASGRPRAEISQNAPAAVSESPRAYRGFGGRIGNRTGLI